MPLLFITNPFGQDLTHPGLVHEGLWVLFFFCIMEQLLLHLLGDYVTQTNWMANTKTKRGTTLGFNAAFLHGLVYTLPFLLLTQSPVALAVMFWSHVAIDHWRLARYVVFAKNWLNEPHLRWDDCQATGYPSSTPAWLAVWLTIVADNATHLAINYAAIRWL